MKKIVLVGLIIVFSVGCGKKRLSKTAQAVEISFEQPSQSCKKIDIVHSVSSANYIVNIDGW